MGGNSRNLISVSEAQNLIYKEASAQTLELVSLEDALNRVLAEDIYSDRDYPPFNRAAVDGFAINTKYFKPGGKYFVAGEILAGMDIDFRLSEGEVIKVMTGAPVPESADAMIKIEESLQLNKFVEFSVQNLSKGQNIARKGEDLKSGSLILKAGTSLSPTKIALLAALGKYKVKVTSLPAITLISTGDEVVPVQEKPKPYQIRDSNKWSITALLEPYKIQVADSILIKDDIDTLTRVLRSIRSRIIIISGGVSMGSADFVPHALTEAGFAKIFHKVAIKPGKPLWFGKKGDTVVFGLPGNPASVQVAFKVFIEPFIRSISNLPPLQPLVLPLMQDRKKKTTFDEYFPCQLNHEEGTALSIIKSNGSGDIKSHAFADGIALHEAEYELLSAGSKIKFYPWHPL